jgi:putative heme-binding domain-containing protein
MSASIGILAIVVSVAVTGSAASFAAAAEVEQGKKLYGDKHCAMCHAIGGAGGKIGPDLSTVGRSRDRDWLLRFLKDPKAVVPGAKMMPVTATEPELAALADYLVSLK